MNRALVLMYHAVDEPRSELESGYCVRPSVFREQMAWLAQSGCTLVSTSRILDALQSGGASLPPQPVAITFDDGLECFERNALPILRLHAVPSTLFAVAGKLGATNDWATPLSWPTRRLLDAASLRDVIREGVTVGCHGRVHRRMTETADSELLDETMTARSELAAAVDQDVTLFAYPYGAVGPRERAAVAKAGFVAAFSTQPGFVVADADRLCIRRIDIYGGDNLLKFKRKIRFGANRVSHTDVAGYYLRRLGKHLSFRD